MLTFAFVCLYTIVFRLVRTLITPGAHRTSENTLISQYEIRKMTVSFLCEEEKRYILERSYAKIMF